MLRLESDTDPPDRMEDMSFSQISLATDLVIRRGRSILFIRRGSEPFKSMLALPGGFVDEGETVEQAAIRELEEETSVIIKEDQLSLIGVFSRVDRDPRQRVVSVAFACQLPAGTRSRAGDDAADTVWMSPTKAFKTGLAFDHADILKAETRRIAK